MEKTLYLSDLDGTLLRSDRTLSSYTCRVIGRLAERGVCFSYATARSIETARKVTEGIRVSLPVIVHNGAFIADSATGETLWSRLFSAQEAQAVFSAFTERGLVPLVYAMIGGRPRFSYLTARCSAAQRAFVASRMDDGRAREISSLAAALDGDVYYFACIFEEEGALLAVKKELEGRFCCLYSRDIYTGAPWLEVMPADVSKASAARVLQEMLGCTKLVCFGDAVNDLALFGEADERYAVANADPVLKAAATAVIGANDEDSVARWLEENAG